MTSEEALQQVKAGGLTLRVADNEAGYFGVALSTPKSNHRVLCLL